MFEAKDLGNYWSKFDSLIRDALLMFWGGFKLISRLDASGEATRKKSFKNAVFKLISTR